MKKQPGIRLKSLSELASIRDSVPQTEARKEVRTERHQPNHAGLKHRTPAHLSSKAEQQ